VSAAPPKSLADSVRARGRVQTQALFRAVNEEIRRLADGFPVLGLLAFVCGCDRRDCLARCSLSLADCEAIRRFPTRFLVKAERVGADERTVSETDEYVLVEQVGRGAASAIRLDPRRRAAPTKAG